MKKMNANRALGMGKYKDKLVIVTKKNYDERYFEMSVVSPRRFQANRKRIITGWKPQQWKGQYCDIILS